MQFNVNCLTDAARFYVLGLTLDNMEIIVNVPADRVAFALEVLRNLTFVESARPKRAAKAKPVEMDTTDYLLSSPANVERLRLAYEQFDRGEGVKFSLPAE